MVEKESAKGSQLVKAVADMIIEMDRGQAKMGTLAYLKVSRATRVIKTLTI